MSNLSTFFGASPKFSKGVGAHRQPAFFTMHLHTSGYTRTSFYNHALNGMGTSPFQTVWVNNNTGTEFATTLNLAGYMMSGNPTSGGGPYLNAGGSNTYEGHLVMSCEPNNPAPTVNGINYNHLINGMRCSMPHCGPNQTFSIFLNGGGSGNYLSVRNRSIQQATDHYTQYNYVNVPGDTVNLSTDGSSGAGNVITASYYSGRGNGCYNQRTKKWVFMERAATSATTNYRPVLLHNGPDPAKFISDDEDLQAAFAACTSTTANRVVGPESNTTGVSSGGTEYTQCGGRVWLDDLNNVWMFSLMENNQTFYLKKWPWNSSSGTWDACTTVESHSYTTVYGLSQSANGGGKMAWQQSLDGKTGIFYMPSYYNHSGVVFLMVDLVAGNSQSLRYIDTTDSINIMPLGATDFILSRSADSNSYGQHHTRFNYKQTAHAVGVQNRTGKAAFAVNGKFQIDADYPQTNYFPQLFQYAGPIDNVAIVQAEKGIADISF